MREIKFRSWNKSTEKMMDWDIMKTFRNINKLISLDHLEVMQYTGFKDSKGNEIYEGDILSDEVQTDEGIVHSKSQVFWNEFTGSWHLDNSFDQDQSYSTELWKELNDFKYKVVGNIHEK